MSKNLPEVLLWREYGPEIIKALDLEQKTTGEWHGPCPNCGGTDRFWINQHKGKLCTHCRQCGDFKAIKDALRDQDLLPRWSPKNQPKISTSTEPYHIRKQIDLNLGECSLSGDKLIVQINDIVTGKERGKQVITNGGKLFSKGTAKEGSGTFVGSRTTTLVICEGYADAQAIHKATNHQALFSLDAGTVPKNVALLQKHDPDLKIIVATDHDDDGIKAAKKAGVTYSLPNKHGEDWHNVFSRLGTEATKTEFEQNLRPPELDVHDTEPDPVDLWGKFGPPEFQHDLLPTLIEEFSLTQAKLTGADASGFAMACLTVCAASMDDNNQLRVKKHDPSWKEPARIWTGIVGDPSTKKTPIISAASKPLCEIDNELFAKYCDELKRWETTEAKDRKGQEPPKHIRKRLEDATPEAAQQVLEHSTSGLLSLQDAIIRFFRRYG